MTEILFAGYLAIGLLVYLRALKFIDERNKERDPEGLDVLLATLSGIIWPITIPCFAIYSIFRG